MEDLPEDLIDMSLTIADIIVNSTGNYYLFEDIAHEIFAFLYNNFGDTYTHYINRIGLVDYRLYSIIGDFMQRLFQKYDLVIIQSKLDFHEIFNILFDHINIMMTKRGRNSNHLREDEIFIKRHKRQ